MKQFINIFRDFRILLLTALLWAFLVWSVYQFFLYSGNIYQEFERFPFGTLGVTISIAASIPILATGIYGFSYFLKRPRLIVGIIPPNKEDAAQYFKRISPDEVHFYPNQLAPAIDEGLCGDKLEAKLKTSCTRTIQVDHDFCTLCIVFQNFGTRMAETYRLIITLDGNVDILCVDTEGLDIDGFYTPNQKQLAGFNFKPPYDVPQSISQFYHDLDLSQAYVRFVSSLEGFGFETICLSIHVPATTNEFCIYYRCECPDIFPQRQLYAQRIQVLRPI